VKLAEQLKTALNDNRLLMLGAQVLFGFQFNAVFQDMFDSLTTLPRAIICAGLMLLVITIGLLITPSMQHRLVEPACASSRMLAVATACAGWALLPLATALALDVFIAMDRIGGGVPGAIGGGAFFILALSLWYFLEFWLRARRKIMPTKEAVKPTPLDAQVEQLLTEARVIIPGGQALLGFQLAVTLTRAFAELPMEARWAHAAALGCVGFAIILLMAPASLHRIAFGGQDHPDFVKIGSAFVIAAPLPLAFGIALDAYVAAGRALNSEALAAVFGLLAIIGLLGVWYGYPLWRRFFAPAT
jgi:hypothetical protein